MTAQGGPESGETVSVTVLWSPPMIRKVQGHAERLGKTPAWVVAEAWRLARGALYESNDSETVEVVAPQRLVLELPAGVFAAVDARATKEGCSVAWVLQRTLQVAWPALEKLG